MEKTPHVIKVAGFLYELFPNMRMVHTIREPKDIYASLLTMQWWHGKSVEHFINWYNGTMDVAYANQLNIPHENYHVVSVERLNVNLEEELRKMHGFLEIDSSRQEFEKCLKRSVRKSTKGRWKDEISSQHADLIDAGCSQLYGLWKERERMCQDALQAN